MNGAIESGAFLDSGDEEIRVLLSSDELAAEDLRRKEKMLRCFETQLGTLSQFRWDVESFRRAPEVRGRM